MRDTVRHHCLFFAHAHCSSFLRPFSSYVKFVMAMFPCSLLIAASRVCHNQVLVWYWQSTCHFFRHSPLSVLPPAWPYQLAFSFFLFLCALFFTELRSFWVVHMAVQCSQWFSFFLFLCLPFCSQNCCPFGLSAGLFDAWHWACWHCLVIIAHIQPNCGQCFPLHFTSSWSYISPPWLLSLWLLYIPFSSQNCRVFRLFTRLFCRANLHCFFMTEVKKFC